VASETTPCFFTLILRIRTSRYCSFPVILNCIAYGLLDEAAIALHQGRPDVHLQRVDRWRISWKFIDRVIVLLAFLSQIIATLFLVLCRMFAVGILYSGADIHSLGCCVSGLTIGVSLVIIEINESRWQRDAPVR